MQKLTDIFIKRNGYNHDRFKQIFILFSFLSFYFTPSFSQTHIDTYNDVSGVTVQREGVTFTITGTYELSMPDSDGKLFGATNYRLTINNFDGRLTSPEGMNFNGKFYTPNDFEGALEPYFRALTISSISVKASITGLKDCKTIQIPTGKSGSSNTNFCTPLKDAVVSISDVSIWDFSVSGLYELQAKIRELENQKKKNEEAEQKAKNTVSNNTASGAKIPGTPGAPAPSGAVPSNNVKSAQVSPQTQAYNLTLEGNTLYSQGRYREALAKYQEAEKLDPANAAIRQNKKNAIDAINTIAQNDYQKAQSEAKMKTYEKAAETTTQIATEVLAIEGGRFGFNMLTVGSMEVIGITWGQKDDIHINFAADLEAFQAMSISMDLVGINFGKEYIGDGSGYTGIFPAMGIDMLFAETDLNGDPIKGSEEFTAFQLGLTGVLEMDGFYFKAGYLYNVAYISGETKTPDSVMIGLGFGIN